VIPGLSARDILSIGKAGAESIPMSRDEEAAEVTILFFSLVKSGTLMAFELGQ